MKKKDEKTRTWEKKNENNIVVMIMITLVKGVDSSEGNLSAEQKVSKKNARILCENVHTWRKEGY